MKIPTSGGFYLSSAARRRPEDVKDNTSLASKNVHAIKENKEEPEGAAGAQAHEADGGVKLAEQTKKVPLCDDIPDRIVIIGKGLEQAEEERLIQFLRNNQDVFS
jgi:hypothetical protein